jgi:uncharacterized protein (DUF4415 family)
LIAVTTCTSFHFDELKNMKRAITLKPPATTSAKRVDPDNPPWTEEMLGAAVVRRGRGPQKAPTKVQTSIRLDADVLAYFKALGAGYQSHINKALREIVDRGLTTPSTGRRSTGLRPRGGRRAP